MTANPRLGHMLTSSKELRRQWGGEADRAWRLRLDFANEHLKKEFIQRLQSLKPDGPLALTLNYFEL
jgi:hypothetical protein